MSSTSGHHSLFISGSKTVGSVSYDLRTMTTSATSTPTTSTVMTVTSSSRGNKYPPLLQKTKSYDDWVKKLKVWRIVKCLPKPDQGGAILMSLEGAEGEADSRPHHVSINDFIIEFLY